MCQPQSGIPEFKWASLNPGDKTFVYEIRLMSNKLDVRRFANVNATESTRIVALHRSPTLSVPSQRIN